MIDRSLPAALAAALTLSFAHTALADITIGVNGWSARRTAPLGFATRSSKTAATFVKYGAKSCTTAVA